MYTLYEATGARSEKAFSLYGFWETNRNLQGKQELSFFTYFNAFFPKDWDELTNIQNVSLRFSGKGNGKIQLLGIKEKGNFYQSELLLEQDFFDSFDLYLNFPENWKSYSIIHPKIISKDKVQGFQLLYLTSDLPSSKFFHIGIVICTYNKQNYLTKTLERLGEFRSDALRISICVVDNAQNLEPNLFAKYSNVILIPNPNYGGSGGFTRGMLYFERQQDVTHILLMDDDIEIDERIFQRLEAILQFQRNSKQAIGGTMLDALLPTLIYETSAKVNYNKLRYEPCNYLLDLTIFQNLITISKKEEIEYGAWWFFLFPKKVLLEAHFSFPFFIRLDDVEYSFRLKKLGYTIHRMNGLAIWHEPFYAKDPMWIGYYTIRNLLIHFALYPKKGRFFRFLRLWMIFGNHIGNYHYLHLELVLNGFKDYLKGPKFIKNLKPNEFHKKLLEICKTDKDFHEEKFEFFSTTQVPRRSNIKKKD